ncbi:galactonate dehydratase [Asanoa sp. NPDC050611]|uniref:galactonate dehydratase n=1 Tax=Asanoa sp. NPDC050611 TaxID=3157098 RepID=UPI0033C1DDC6
MRIISVETFLVPPRLLFLRIGTDTGIVGWGEPIVEGRARTVRAAIDEMASLLLGADPRRIEDLWQTMTRGTFYRGGPVLSSAVAGVDQALWDITGQALGAPVHALLGGAVRSRVRVYAAAHGPTPAALAADATRLVALGYTAVKIGPPGSLSYLPAPHELVARVAAVRAAVGPSIDVALDLHGRASLPFSRRLLPLLEPHFPLFVEEPVRPEYADQVAALAGPVPLALGERLYDRRAFRAVLDAGVAVVQPDPSHAGGISEVRRIAAVAEMYDAVVAPHCPLGPIALAACLQLDATIPNFLVQEQSLGVHAPADIPFVRDPSVFAMSEGHLRVLTDPGLGIEVDEDAVRAADRVGHDWRAPIDHHTDGSFAEW